MDDTSDLKCCELPESLTKSAEVTMPWLGQSSGLLICSKEPILSEQHHVFQQRRRVTAKGWLEVEAETRETWEPWDTWEPWETWGKGEVNLGRRSSEEKQ